MDIQMIIERAKGILLKPRREWQLILHEPYSNKELLLYFVLPLAGLAALIRFIVILVNSYLGFAVALQFAVYQLVLPVITIVVAAVVINELADTFESVKSLNNAFKLVVYSYTPVLLISILTSISWTLGFLGLLGLYGVYLLWVGLPIMMRTPEEKRLVYIIVALVVIFLVNIVVSALFGSERMGYY